jgi:GNAT superfamily N-acetyltransferase
MHTPSPDILIRRLEPSDDRSSFRSGNLELDRYFQLYAGQNQFRHHISSNYVAIQGDNIRGFATVTTAQLERQQLPAENTKNLPAYCLPVVRLARLAVAQQAQGQGIGLRLMAAVFGLAHRLAADIGCVGVMVDAKPEAQDFYRKLGFLTIELTRGQLGDRPQPVPMFLNLKRIPLDASPS